jgi:two-component sensor histidine kinase
MPRSASTDKSPTEYSLRTHLLTYGLVVAIPLLILLGVFLMRTTEFERDQLEQRMRQIAGALADDIDRELDRRLTMLQTLATSPALATGDLAAFHAQATAAVATIDAGVFLIEPSTFQQLVNTRRPYGSPIPTYGSPETAARVVTTGQPQISDLFIGKVLQRPVYDIALPIRDERHLRYILVLGLEPADMLPILQGRKLGTEWIALIADRNDVILARSRNHDRFVGKDLPPGLRRDRMAHAGVFNTANMDGQQVVMAQAFSRLAGWRISVNVPVVVVEAPLRASLWQWGGVALAAIALTVVAGSFLAFRIAKPIGIASAAAVALGRGELIQPQRSALKEANRLLEVLLASRQELVQRTTGLVLARAEADARASELQAVLDHTPAAIWISRDPHCRSIQGNAAADAMWATAHAGRSMPPAHEWAKSPQCWRGGRQLAVDELPLQRAAATGQAVTEEIELRFVDGRVTIVAGSATPLKDGAGNVTGAIAVFVDISELRKAEQHQRVLIRELSHRVKNTLAIVQAIVSQTLRSELDPHAFERALSARLRALAGAHNLLTAGAWRGASLAHVVDAALAPFQGRACSVRITGPDITLPANMTITVSLVLHELATNAAKYGALSSPDGYVSISWEIAEEKRRRRVSFHWSEHQGPVVREPQRKGFGSRLLEASALQLDGELTLEHAAEGLRLRLNFPVATDDPIGGEDRAAPSDATPESEARPPHHTPA